MKNIFACVLAVSVVMTSPTRSLAQAKPNAAAAPDAGVVGAPPPGVAVAAGSTPRGGADGPSENQSIENCQSGDCGIVLERYGGQKKGTPRGQLIEEAAVDQATAKMRQKLIEQPGIAQGGSVTPESALADTLQLVGQLVTDRASARAFELTTSRLKEGFSCDKPLPNTIQFPVTCDALARLRIQDLAAAPKTLEASLSADLIAYVEDRFGGQRSPDERAKLGLSVDFSKAARELIDHVLLPWARRDARWPAEQDVVRFVQALIPEGGGSADDPAVQVGALASLAAAQCLAHGIPCSLGDIVAEMCSGRDCFKQKDAIVTVASDLVVAIAAVDVTTSVKVDIEARIDAAVSALSHLACVSAGESCEDIAKDDLVKSKDPNWARARLTVRLRALVHAMVTNDGLGIGFSAARFVDDAVAMDAQSSSEHDVEIRRATRLVATLVNYAETYAGTDGLSKDARSAREQILQSLVDDFTDRTEREGDWILSVGGSLRAAAGLRLGPNHPAFYGPLSLVLGLGLDVVHKSSFHSELGLVDLGEYLSFTSEDGHLFVVDKPTVRQAISPSLTLAWSFAGPSMPGFLGVVGGAAPFRNDTAKLRWYAGATLGVYVPLFDVN